MDAYQIPTLSDIRATLAASPNDPNADIVKRMRALFYARYYDSDEAIIALQSALTHPSVLLRHEVAYVMGQMTQPAALPVLIRLLEDESEHCMVRHEAAEGIAALGLTVPQAFEAVKKYLNDPCKPVAETCYLALRGLERTKEKEAARGEPNCKMPIDPTKGFYIFTASNQARIEKEEDKSTFGTYDPAEGDAERERNECVPALGALLKDEKADLWDRYIAMFTLRNIATVQSAQALADALDEKSSPLLRHEICFVLGQLQKPVAFKKLAERLEDKEEIHMVRHEAALALGSVGADIWTPAGKVARRASIKVL
eukprot:Blabericola_migrator_1__7806@NODE_3999_length_1392_cov_194_239245_g2466_i0_p1_GENE_NODE_3999_length_1392_cov_194_239245_g2466_i0NODE_3999_length_1392_cov_194_239245_g2466_i0_p1_ORF_typecomplete_len313_score70_00HEAT_2/PF13646_6/4_4e15HEAT_2/PF13646_6/0_12HEAT_2/PF13646_6/5_7e10HEAT_PBS/PF03130_16/0_0028HEAT_PBS/PF03130_16/0_36HEAT_PBS/PF03130_16/8_9e02HEAT_PBS/PF03130_16/3_7HEAT_PBS/PF03130_16/1_5e04HEAT_PBS/PF03130_16/1_4HEAT_EZ/PF13513_6/2_8e03HEAT_EZ/PF13513_6/1_9HEAT_EZ/PF13513_6/1_2e02HEAT_